MDSSQFKRANLILSKSSCVVEKDDVRYITLTPAQVTQFAMFCNEYQSLTQQFKLLVMLLALPHCVALHPDKLDRFLFTLFCNDLAEPVIDALSIWVRVA